MMATKWVIAGVLAMAMSAATADAAQSTNTDTIDVVEASYAKNVSIDQSGNATSFVKQACDGKRSCGFPVSRASGQIGDIKQGARKAFEVSYMCGDRLKTVYVEGEATGKVAFLTCSN